MSEGDRRSAKLHKQLEVDDDSEGLPSDSCGLSSRNISSLPTPTVIPASSSSSEASPEEPSSSQPPTATLSRKQTLTRTPAFEGTSPPPESFLAQVTGGGDGSVGGGGGIPSISLVCSTSCSHNTPTPLQQVITTHRPSLANGTTSTLTITPNDQNARSNKTSNQAKEFLLASHTSSNDSGRGTLDDSDLIPRDSCLESNAIEAMATHAPSSSSPSLSAYTDSIGTNLIQFFKSTLRKSAKDKKTLLAVERDLIAFIEDQAAQSYKMNEMNPYDRMVAHRVAAYYGLDHNVDQSGKCIIVTRCSKTRMPDLKLMDIGNTPDFHIEPKIVLKKPSSFDEKQTRNTKKDSFGPHKAKSFEERQQNYDEVRERIFKVEEGSGMENQGQSSSGHLLNFHHHHPPLMSQQRSLDSMRDARQHHQHQSQASFARPLWSSTDSSGYGTQEHQHLHRYSASSSLSPSAAGRHQLLPPASAIPFIPSHHHHRGGIAGARLSSTTTTTTGGDTTSGLTSASVEECDAISVPAIAASAAAAVPLPQPLPPTHAQGFHYHHHHRSSPMVTSTTTITNTPLSASATVESVGPMFESPPSHHPSTYELSNTPTGSMSDQSPASRPPSGAGLLPMTQPSQYPTVAYLVSTDLASIPPGSCIINPDTMQPHLNPDGSLYQYDSACPPPFIAQSMTATAPQQAPANQIAQTSFVCQPDPGYGDLTARFAETSLVSAGDTLSGGQDPMALGLNPAGQAVSLMSSHGPSSGLVQAQFLSGSPQVLGGGPIRYIYALPPGAQQVMAGGTATTALDPNSQINTMVPLPPGSTFQGFPASFGAGGNGGYQIINPGYIQTAGGAAAVTTTPVPPCIDLSSGYSLTPADQAMNVMAGGGGGNPQTIPASSLPQNVIQTYSVTPYPPVLQQQQQQPTPHHHIQQQHPSSHSQHTSPPFNPSNVTSLPPGGAASAASYFTGVPLTNTNSPSPLSQQQQQQTHYHQQQQQQQPTAILYNLGGVPVSPLTFSTLPPSSSTGISKSNSNPQQHPVTTLHTTQTSSYHHQTPPPPPLQQQHHYHHHHPPPPPPLPLSSSQQPQLPPQQTHSHQQQHNHHPQSQNHLQQQQQQQLSTSSSSIPPSNGYHHPHHHPVTYNFSQPAVTFIPNQAMTSQSQGSQLVTLPSGSYHHQLRPVGTIIPMPASAQGIVPSPTATPAHIQFVRPAGPVQDVRMLQPGVFHPRLPGVTLYGSYSQGRSRNSNPNRSGKGSKKSGLVSGSSSSSSSHSQQQHHRKQHSPAPPPSQQQQQHPASCNSPSLYPSPLLPPTSSSTRP